MFKRPTQQEKDRRAVRAELDVAADALRANEKAFQEALAEPETVTAQITVQLIEKDGQWWALTDQARLDILSGGLR